VTKNVASLLVVVEQQSMVSFCGRVFRCDHHEPLGEADGVPHLVLVKYALQRGRRERVPGGTGGVTEGRLERELAQRAHCLLEGDVLR
jgi:hypothetical protein